MNKIFYTRHDGGLSFIRNGKQSTVSSTAKNFDVILSALKAKRYDELEMLMSPTRTINATGTSRKLKGRKIYVKGGVVFFDDPRGKTRELAGPLVDRILQDLGKSAMTIYADALLKFMDNMMKNKRKDIRNELYEWLMSGKTPITYDGCFLAYKKVRGDFMDIFSGTKDNSPGKLVRMPQDQVDTNRNNDCSVGLHFCSLGYLQHYNGSDKDKVVIVKVNPRHVFAIPRDYSHQKGRASEYYVVGECRKWTSDVFHDAFISEETKDAAAPDVKFVKYLRPSLEIYAESHGLMEKGKVRIAVVDGKYIPAKIVEGKSYDLRGRPVPWASLQLMSLETKSVRAAVKAAIDKVK